LRSNEQASRGTLALTVFASSAQRVGGETLYVLSLRLLLTALLAASLVYRERKGIGFEGVAILVVYCAGFTTVALSSH